MSNDFWDSKAIKERYKLVYQLGKGATGMVYKAKDLTLDKLVAIKVLASDLSNEQSMRFQQEARLSGKLKHDNIVSILDFGVTEHNKPYLVMEHLQGSSLAEHLKKDGNMDLKPALSIFIGISKGMMHSHGQDILHRDLKPENVILVEGENDSLHPKVVDFGLARLKETDAHLTRSGVGVGSPLYMAPEQAEGTADERSDIYSMGCLMYKTLTGSPPFRGATAIETLMMHKSDALRPLSEQFRSPFAQEMEEVVSKCLEKNPNDRYQTFQELLSSLTAIQDLLVDEDDDESKTSSEDEEDATTSKKIRVWQIVACVLFLAACSGAIYFSVMRPPEPEVVKLEKPIADAPVDPQIAKDSQMLENFNNRELTRTNAPDGLQLVAGSHDFNDDDLIGSIQNYPTVHTLILKRCSVTGKRFDEVTSTISQLFLDSSLVNDEGLRKAVKIKGLRKISIRKSDWATDEGLKNCVNLYSLLFSGKHFSERSLKALSSSKTLNKLQLGDMNITADGIKALLAIKSVSGVQFQNCKLTADAFAEFNKGRKLDYVCFSDKKIEEDELDKILEIPSRELALLYTEIPLKGLRKLRGNTRIVYIDVTSAGITNKERADILRSLPNCSYKAISEKSIEEEITGDPSLRQFGMHD